MRTGQTARGPDRRSGAGYRFSQKGTGRTARLVVKKDSKYQIVSNEMGRMEMMKKTTALLLAVLTLLNLCACGTPSGTTPAETAPAETAPAETHAEESAEAAP